MNSILLLCATLIAAGPVEPSARWSGKITDKSLLELAPETGFLNDADSFVELWKAWRPAEDVPEVDFEKELILVGASSGPNSVMMRPALDDAGNLKYIIASTRVAGPGFGYLLLKIGREGVVTVNGTAVDTRLRKVRYETHDGYFVSNKFEPGEASSFVVLRNQEDFDLVFGVAFVMNDKSRRLARNAFESKIVVGAIHRGNSLWSYKVKSVESDGNTLTVRYTTSKTARQTATFSSPLIISLPAGDYTVVQFEEDGELVKTLKTEMKSD